MPLNIASLLKRPRRNDPVIIVSGLPRSGTSMMMKVLAAGGLEVLTDNLRSPDENNPKGYYEFERVKKMPDGDLAWVKEARGKVVKIISALLQYLPLEYNYKIIFMRRNIDEILASQRQMLIRAGKPDSQNGDQQMAELFSKHLRQVEMWLANQPKMEVLYISYNETLRDPSANIARVNQFLDVKLKIPAMEAVIDPNLYRERA
jgi:LPS sulfotransferase NodH